MPDIDKATKTVGKIEGFIEAVWGLLKRHWGKMIVLSILGLVFWFCKAVYDELENPSEEYYEEAAPLEQDSSDYYYQDEE